MRRLAVLVLVFFTAQCGISLGASQDARSVEQIAKRAVEDLIRPAFAEFSTSATEFERAMAALCATPDEPELTNARSAFAQLVSAFSAIELYRLGPLSHDNRFERILFWPDRKGRALRRIQSTLTNRDPSVLQAENLAGKSVAIQGLGALEYLLFGTGAASIVTGEDTDGFRCEFAKSIARNVNLIATDLKRDWEDPSGFSALLLRPGGDNKTYQSPIEVAVELFGVLVHGFERIKDLKLRPVLGETTQKAKPKRSVFWRSGLTFPNMAGNLQALANFQTKSGLLDGLAESRQWMAAQLIADTERALALTGSLRSDVLDAFVKPEPRQRLSYLFLLTDGLRDLAVTEIGTELGLQAGFSVLDGD